MDILDHGHFEREAQLKKYTASIDMARMPVFILTGYLLFVVCRYFYDVRDLDYQIIRPHLSVIGWQACVELAILTITFFSYSKPYPCMLLLLIIVSLVIILGIGYDVYLFYAARVKPTTKSLIVVVPFVIDILLIRAVDAAKKYERLKKTIAN